MIVQDNAMTVDIYSNLRKTGPFIPYGDEDVAVALENSLYNVVVFDKYNNAIGMARIVGDGRIVFIIKDVVVTPEFQKQGLGDLIMKRLFKYIQEHACENAYIGLMSTPHKEGFYENYGFIRRPNINYGAGMVMFYKEENFLEENNCLWKHKY